MPNRPAVSRKLLGYTGFLAMRTGTFFAGVEGACGVLSQYYRRWRVPRGFQATPFLVRYALLGAPSAIDKH